MKTEECICVKENGRKRKRNAKSTHITLTWPFLPNSNSRISVERILRLWDFHPTSLTIPFDINESRCTILIERSPSQKRAYNAAGINLLSQTWLQGPWPRSWHSPASSTQPTSRSVMLSSGWLCCRCVAIMRARYATPEPANELCLDKAMGLQLAQRVFESSMGGTRPNKRSRSKLFDVPQPLKLFPGQRFTLFRVGHTEWHTYQ